MQALLDGVRARIELTADCEITMEANPGTVEADKFAGFQRAGINRISIGVQSFQQEKLTRLGRIHGPEEARKAAELAHAIKLPTFNLDLMHGLPDQSLADALGSATGHRLRAAAPLLVSAHHRAEHGVRLQAAHPAGG